MWPSSSYPRHIYSYFHGKFLLPGGLHVTGFKLNSKDNIFLVFTRCLEVDVTSL